MQINIATLLGYTSKPTPWRDMYFTVHYNVYVIYVSRIKAVMGQTYVLTTGY